jgi:hypothetical protein
MTSEMNQKCYMAVRCFYCSEPIRLSIRLLELCHIDSDSTNAELQFQPQVFILRCDACSKEICYLKTQIETFEGDARKTSDAIRATPNSYPRSFLKAAGL